MKKYGIELLEYLCQKFGPTGFENEVADAIIEQLGDDCDKIVKDTFGNVYALVKGSSDDRVMISSHMDEVGFMITDIDSDGYIKFANLGGIDPKVLYGKQVVLGNEKTKIYGRFIACCFDVFLLFLCAIPLGIRGRKRGARCPFSKV